MAPPKIRITSPSDLPNKKTITYSHLEILLESWSISWFLSGWAYQHCLLLTFYFQLQLIFPYKKWRSPYLRASYSLMENGENPSRKIASLSSILLLRRSLVCLLSPFIFYPTSAHDYQNKTDKDPKHWTSPSYSILNVLMKLVLD